MARIDVLMPVKNGAAYVASAVQSIVAQTVTDWRLLVLDHGSTDDTRNIVAAMASRDRRIELCLLPHPVGLAGLLNEGLARVNAPYVMRMDADDESVPERMAITLAAFEQYPQAAVIGGQADIIDAQGRHTGRTALPCLPAELERTMLFHNAVVHPAVCLRTDAIAERGIRYGRSMQRDEEGISMHSLAEDYLLFGELAIDGAVANVPDVLLRYRHHAGGVSRAKFSDQLIASATVSRHLAARLACRAGCAPFDPAPFCSHGATLASVGNGHDYRDAHAAMSDVLQRLPGAWQDGAGELAWRGVFIDRNPLGIATRAAWRARRCGAIDHERATVRNAVQQLIRRRPMVAVAALPSPATTRQVACPA